MWKRRSTKCNILEHRNRNIDTMSSLRTVCLMTVPYILLLARFTMKKYRTTERQAVHFPVGQAYAKIWQVSHMRLL